MKYLIIGAGGTGACIAGYLAQIGKDVTLIARNRHLDAIKKDGLIIKRPNDTLNIKLKAQSEQEYDDKADIIFICVKYYSLEEIYDLTLRAAHADTVIIPVLNVYGSGEKMAAELKREVLNGCIYIDAAIEDYGIIKQSGSIFRVVYGCLDGDISSPALNQVKADLEEANIEVIFSADIKKDTMQKFAFISPMASVGAYHQATIADIKREGQVRQDFIDASREIIDLTQAMGISLAPDTIEANLKIIANLADYVTASMQKDLVKGGPSEIDGLLFQVVRWGQQYGVSVPTYSKLAQKWQD